jgi:hypothetical protein
MIAAPGARRMSHLAATLSLAAVAAVSAVLFILAVRAATRTGERPLWFVAAAFGLFAVKGALTAWALSTDAIRHETLEIAGGAFDLAIVVLLITPFLVR